MIFDSQTNRYITKDGKSILSDEDYIYRLTFGKDVSFCRVLDSEEGRSLEFYKGEKVVFEDDEPEYIESKQLYSGDIGSILERVEGSPRYTQSQEEEDRIYYELEYFERTNNISFINAIIHTVDKLKEDGVVWGVGRGSSCASFLLYVLEVNDVNPLDFAIPFSEMSKEQ